MDITKLKINEITKCSRNNKVKLIMNDNPNIRVIETFSDTPSCIRSINVIFFNKASFINPGMNDLFDLLHEIGHFKTNTNEMTKCMQEFLATKWAIDNMGRYNVKVTKKRIKEYQKYIYEHRAIEIDKGVIVPSKKELMLIY